MSRCDNRHPEQLRPYKVDLRFLPYAMGSCMIYMGNTRVLCAATVEEKLPPFLRDKKRGWITAEYSMLPCSTHTRTERESVRGKQSGRTQEIQRLIGRSLRAIVDCKALGERQIKIDCDVICADGGTRCAAITGAYLALYQAIQKLIDERKLRCSPIKDQVAAVSCGIVEGVPMLDLCYEEDVHAEVDGNFVLTHSGKIIEIQMTGERIAFTAGQAKILYSLALAGVHDLFKLQKESLALMHSRVSI